MIDEIRDAAFAPQQQLRDLAAKQLGTVGAGNHYVDLFADEQDRVWIGVHFGSRGFGHKTASGFLALAQGLPFEGRASEGEMDAPPTLLAADSELGAQRGFVGATMGEPAAILEGVESEAAREALYVTGTTLVIDVGLLTR